MMAVPIHHIKKVMSKSLLRLRSVHASATSHFKILLSKVGNFYTICSHVSGTSVLGNAFPNSLVQAEIFQLFDGLILNLVHTYIFPRQ